MGGTNPYIKAPEGGLPRKKYKISFSNRGITVEVDPVKIPYSGTGLPGSVLDVALGSDVDVDHACGGVCACSTCHVYVRSGLGSCPPAEMAELDMLDNAPDVKPYSRLACQCVPSGDEDIVVEIPEWNRNLIREGK